MKKYLLGLSLIILIGISIVGCSSNNKLSNNSENTQSASTIEDTTKISVKEAAKIYHDTFPKTSIISVELQKKLGKPIYVVEGADDTTEYQLDINAVNKKIKQKSEEPVDEEDQNEAVDNKIDLENVISLKKASRLAKKAAKGGNSTEFKLEKEHGITYWEIKVKNGNSEKEIKINAKNGKVLEVDND